MRDDRGAASVVAVAVAGVWLVLVLAGVRLGDVVVERHRLGAAADLAALAAAGQLRSEAAPQACRRAGQVVGRMGGRLVKCQVDGVEVRVEVSGEPSLFGAPSARARAGPADR